MAPDGWSPGLLDCITFAPLPSALLGHLAWSPSFGGLVHTLAHTDTQGAQWGTPRQDRHLKRESGHTTLCPNTLPQPPASHLGGKPKPCVGPAAPLTSALPPHPHPVPSLNSPGESKHSPASQPLYLQ